MEESRGKEGNLTDAWLLMRNEGKGNWSCLLLVPGGYLVVARAQVPASGTKVRQVVQGERGKGKAAVLSSGDWKHGQQLYFCCVWVCTCTSLSGQTLLALSLHSQLWLDSDLWADLASLLAELSDCFLSLPIYSQLKFWELNLAEAWS